MSDRYKISIQPVDEQRVLVYDSKGLDPDMINKINDLCMKEEWRDVYFATLDDDRVGIVCKPTTFVQLMNWRNKKYGKKFPMNLKKEFMKAANEALKHGRQLYQYKEDLTKEETELKKALEDEAMKGIDTSIDDDTTWTQEK